LKHAALFCRVYDRKGTLCLKYNDFCICNKKSKSRQTQFAISIIRIETRRYVDKYFGVDPES
jgi:hypothetical protein